jgi:hypothetical protein
MVKRERGAPEGSYFIRVQTYGLPQTVERMAPSAAIPYEWAPRVTVASVLGAGLLGGLARFHETR